jgi:hypothetical protein
VGRSRRTEPRAVAGIGQGSHVPTYTLSPTPTSGWVGSWASALALPDTVLAIQASTLAYPPRPFSGPLPRLSCRESTRWQQPGSQVTGPARALQLCLGLGHPLNVPHCPSVSLPGDKVTDKH